MGMYLNPGNVKFEQHLSRRLYVDKTGLIACLNDYMRGVGKYMCVTRPRRFGKSVAADMLTAYYSRGCHFDALFDNLAIAVDESYREHLNRHNVIYFDVAQIIKKDVDAKTGIKKLTKKISAEIKKENPDIDFEDDDDDIISMFEDVFGETGTGFVFIVDEWDCPFRERKNDTESQDIYLQFLKYLFKNHDFVTFVYMTGILPIKKYGSNSTLNMFSEYTMLRHGPVKEYIGFTSDEVKALCERYSAPFDELKYWYDGYNLDGIEIYNPNSVYRAVTENKVEAYWTDTEYFEDLLSYIKDNRFGIHKIILDLVNEERGTLIFPDIRTTL